MLIKFHGNSTCQKSTLSKLLDVEIFWNQGKEYKKSQFYCQIIRGKNIKNHNFIAKLFIHAPSLFIYASKFLIFIIPLYWMFTFVIFVFGTL